jgi:hypothetical protein
MLSLWLAMEDTENGDLSYFSDLASRPNHDHEQTRQDLANLCIHRPRHGVSKLQHLECGLVCGKPDFQMHPALESETPHMVYFRYLRVSGIGALQIVEVVARVGILLRSIG